MPMTDNVLDHPHAAVSTSSSLGGVSCQQGEAAALECPLRSHGNIHHLQLGTCTQGWRDVLVLGWLWEICWCLQGPP